MFQALYTVTSLVAIVILYVQVQALSERTDDIEYYPSQDDEDDISDPQ
ncbi:hypothetical protein UFOVP59_10 [uncultured Caudovirales phage]|uniref:Uncharacterized protein n=1 Tax=uncultured Caudovirales phage TaxID=2100421 RepID=A0A6J7WV19_9CAUD|nr:hypothetical protein UFOVP59_10 [uncultured Caudovirales phage]CAB5220675.1 hypothetical protein UFOVP246_22 [uncultured Caudovirales phage]